MPRILPLLRVLIGAALLSLPTACGSPAPTPTALPPPTSRPTTTSVATLTPVPPTVTLTVPPTTPTIDTRAITAYATITALAANEAATATAAAAPTLTPTPISGPAVPTITLGTYRLIVTARVEGNRVYREAGTLVLIPAAPGSGHSAELQFWRGVRAGREYADLSPGTTVGGLYVSTRAALLPAGFDQATPYTVAVVYNPNTKFLTVTGDPLRGLPGGWSTGLQNKEGKPRPITAGTITLDLGRPGHLSGQFDLSSLLSNGKITAYSGGVQGDKR